MRQPPETITLDQVEEVYPYGLPLIHHDTRQPAVGIEEFYKQDLAKQMGRQLVATFRSLRDDPESPHTVLHSLMLRDGQTIGQLAANMHVDPRSLQHDLDIAIESGWVIEAGERPLKSYTLLSEGDDLTSVIMPVLPG